MRCGLCFISSSISSERSHQTDDKERGWEHVFDRLCIHVGIHHPAGQDGGPDRDVTLANDHPL